MKIWSRSTEQWSEEPDVVKALAIDWSQKHVIAAVGAGGKTTVLKQLAKELSSDGYRVILTTTTHLLMPDPPELLAENLDKIKLDLAVNRFSIAGRPDGKDKMMGLPSELFACLPDCADIVLVEADGAKHLPLKVPAEHEPVIPKQTTHVLVLAGMSGLGQAISTACHRPEQVCALLETSAGHILDSTDLVRLLREGYWQNQIEQKHLPGTIILSQVHTTMLQKQAEGIAAALAPIPCLITDLSED